MKPETVIVTEPLADDSDQSEMTWPEPQTDLGTRLIALAKEIDASELPRLSLEEVEEYLGRELGGIAAAYGDMIEK